MKLTLTIIGVVAFLNQAPVLTTIKDTITQERGDDIVWRQTVQYTPGYTLGSQPFRQIRGSWEGLPAISLAQPIKLSL